MFYKALNRVWIRAEPDQTSDDNKITRMQKGEIGVTIKPEPVNGFVNLAVLGSSRKGWVLLRDNQGPLLEEVDAPPLNDFELSDFIPACVDAEITFNKSVDDKTTFFVVADFLIAWADIASGIKNKAGDDKDPKKGRLGPFQISAEDWQRFLDSPEGKEWGPADRLNGLQQPFGAAFLVLEAMSAISGGIGTSDPVAGPYIPSYVDVLLALMLGAKAAVELRKAKIADKGPDSAKTVLQPLFSDDDNLKKLSEFRGKLRKNRSIDDNGEGEPVNFLTDNAGQVETIEGLLTNAENLLDAELQTAFTLIKEKDPDDLPKLDGTAPWMDVANAELAAWHGDKEDKPDRVQRIKDYFAAINVPHATGTEAWCGAFVGFCLTERGAKVPKDAGWAPNWVNWGSVSVPPGQPEIPKGAIVTISAGKETNKVGHVGFCDSSDPNRVVILGGNQGNTVSRTPFPRSRIVAIRWLNAAGAASPRTPTGPEPPPADRERHAMDFFVNQGWSRQQAAGIVANLLTESRLAPDAVGDGGLALGIAQWHPDRQANFQQFSGQAIVGSSLDQQLSFVQHELTVEGEVPAGNRLRQTTSANDAGATVSKFYERPADRDGEARRRGQRAERVLTNNP